MAFGQYPFQGYSPLGLSAYGALSDPGPGILSPPGARRIVKLPFGAMWERPAPKPIATYPLVFKGPTNGMVPTAPQMSASDSMGNLAEDGLEQGTLPPAPVYPAVMPPPYNPAPATAAGAQAGGEIGMPQAQQSAPQQDTADQVSVSASRPEDQSTAAMWGLLAAGLGILANNRGNYGRAGPAIGQGGLMGLQTYLGQKQAESSRQMAREKLMQEEALRQQQININRQQIEAQTKVQTRADAKQKQIDALVEQIAKETDPLKVRSLMRQAALLEGKPGDVYRTDYTEKPARPVKTIEGAGGELVKEVWRNPTTNEVMWEGEPYKRGSINMVNQMPPGETAFQKGYGGKQSERAVGIETMAEKAYDAMHKTDQAMDLARRWTQSGGQLGKAADLQTFVTEIMQAMNLKPAALGLPADAGPSQALEAISNGFVLSKIGGEGGMPANNFSNADREFLQRMKPQRSNTPEGFILTAMLERGAARRAIARDEMLQNELEAFPDNEQEKAYQSFRRKWRKYVSETPAWTEQEIAEMQKYREMLGSAAPGAPSSNQGMGSAWKGMQK